MSESEPSLVAYVINLDASTDRLASAERQFGEVAQLQFGRIPAVDGRAIPERELAAVYSKWRAVWRLGREMTRTEIGCALSHIDACRRFLASDADVALICEDDLQMEDDFAEVLAAVLGCSQDWDIAALNRMFPAGRVTSRHPVPGLPTHSFCTFEDTVWGAIAYLVKRDVAAAMVTERVSVPSDTLLHVDFRSRVRNVIVEPNPVVAPIGNTLMDQRGSRPADRKLIERLGLRMLGKVGLMWGKLKRRR